MHKKGLGGWAMLRLRGGSSLQALESLPQSWTMDMGPFLLTQTNPIHQLMDPIQSNPKIAGIQANS